MRRKFHIIAYGCQMNRYDSDALHKLLLERGHLWEDDPEKADLVVVNTCAVRQHAEDRALGRLETLLGIKKRKPNFTVGIMGCVAQREGDNLIKRFPSLDFVVGTDEFAKIADITEADCNGVFTQVDDTFSHPGIHAYIDEGQNASFITIMRGCNNYCAYCIVPYVRGNERSVRPDVIIDEIAHAVDAGVFSITLLGQNVNSYNYEKTDFPRLLRKIAESPKKPKRIKFVTNHPKDFSDSLIDVLVEYSEIMPAAFHLPLQSGSDAILRAMNRKYSLSNYMHIVEKIYSRFPDASIATDIIAGFPGETDTDFRHTLDAMRTVGFSGTFAFKFSPRPSTAAAAMHDDVPEELKIHRLKQIINCGIEQATKFSQSFAGSVQNVLVEKSVDGKCFGEAPTGRRVEFFGDCAPGDFARVRIESAKTWVLVGKPLHP